jgi:hypothetical protein
MQFELEYFGEVIEKELRDRPLKQEFDDYFMRAYTVTQTATRFKTKMNDAKSVYSLDQRKEFVSLHQHRLIHYADEVTDIMRDAGLEALLDGPDDTTRVNLARYLFYSIEELILALERNFPDLFDHDTTVPEAYTLRVHKELETMLPELTQQLKNLSCDMGLIHAATEPLAQFVFALHRMSYSYRDIFYLNLLVGEMSKVIESDLPLPKDEPRRVLFKRLCIINLNSDMFYEYITDRCTEKLDKAAHLADKALLLIHMIAKCEGTKLMDGVALNPQSDSIKKTVMAWLLSKQAALEAEIKIKERFGAQIRLPEDEMVDNGKKLSLNITGGEFAVWVRKHYESDFFSSKKKEEIFEFFTTHYTIKGNPISRDTFATRYNTPPDESKNKIQDLFKKMGRSGI